MPNGVWFLQLRGNNTTTVQTPFFPEHSTQMPFARIEIEDQIHKSERIASYLVQRGRLENEEATKRNLHDSPCMKGQKSNQEPINPPPLRIELRTSRLTV